MNSALCLYEASDAVATVRLNRPDARNALNVPILEALLEALESARRADVTVVVLGAAGPHFCSGADLAEGMPGRVLSGGRTRRELIEDALDRLTAFPASVAVVRGAAVGAGWAFALACDVVLASPTATFRFPELSHGVTPPELAVRRLAREVGPRRALSLIADERRHPAGELAPLGLVDVVADEWLEQAAQATSTLLAARDRGALSAVKTMLAGAHAA